MPYTLLLAATLAAAPTTDTAPIDCGNCAAWNAPHAPFRLHGDSWYVGPDGLGSVVVKTSEGLVLIDGALPQSAEVIVANLEAIGFDIADVRWLLNSHPHWDHAGGLAALQRLSGAPVVSTMRGVEALRAGDAPHDDPQVGFGDSNRFPPVANAVALQDGQTLTVGGVVFTMHATPGHTPGGASWQWRSCVGSDCRDLVFADSLTAVAADGFRFVDDPARIAQFRATIARVAALPCELVVSAHPSQSGLFEKFAAGAPSPFDPQACARYAAGGAERLEARLAAEDSGSP